MRTVLIGAVGSTELVLRAMQEAGHPPALLVTLPPELGRRRHADFVNLAALTDPSTEVVLVDSSEDHALLAQIEALAPDVIFAIGWSQIIGPRLRAAARRYCVGFHPTLLPALRGRAVIGWTILLGLDETGATLFELGEGADDGAILAQTKIALGPRENVGSIFEKMTVALAEMIQELIPRLADGTATTSPQPDGAISYCARRTADDNRIEWSSDSLTIDRLIRASSKPYSGAFTFTRKRRITIWSAEPFAFQHPYHAAPGQIVVYVDGDPIVRCGDGEFLRITEYETEGAPLSGQARLRNRLDEEQQS